ncbi:hypothetical protein ACFE04_010499 [Oxalis oulophora]
MSCWVWNYEESKLLTSFDNHSFPDKGISKLCLMNELATACFSVRVWKDYRIKSKQKHVTAFSSIQGHKSGVWSLNVVVDWQQQSGYLYAFGELSSINIWDMDKEQLASRPKFGQVHMSAPKVDNFINLLENRITPSWVAFTDSERLIGEAAKNLAAVNLEKTIFDVKRFIGGK